MTFKSVKFKISVYYTVISGFILILYSGFLYFSLTNSLYRDLDRELRGKADQIAQGISGYLNILGEEDLNALIFAARRIITLKGEYPGGNKQLSSDQKRKIVAFEKDWSIQYSRLNLGEDFIHILRDNGQSLVKSHNVPSPLRSLMISHYKDRKKTGASFKKIKTTGRNLYFIQEGYPGEGKAGLILQIGTSKKPLIDLLESRAVMFFISIPVVLILTSFIGRVLADRILKPVKDITQTARNITHEDLSRRIKSWDVDEEMHSLVEAFNDMIARLETSFNLIAEFSSQVAHELKTPIAIMRGEIELALRKERSAEEYKRALRISLEETQRLLKTVEDLLLLAKLDYRPEIFHFEYFDLSELFQELFEQTKILASDKNIQARLSLPEKPVTFKGDALHLRRLFYNIIHNAVKFTSPGGLISIAVKPLDHQLVIAISDTGRGISRVDLPRIFDRFFHKDTFDPAVDPGSGLGLNIALSIAKIHRGQIGVTSELDKGTEFTVTLPIL